MTENSRDHTQSSQQLNVLMIKTVMHGSTADTNKYLIFDSTELMCLENAFAVTEIYAINNLQLHTSDIDM